MTDTMNETDRWAMAPAGLLGAGDPWAPDYSGKPTATALAPALAGIFYTVPRSTMGTDTHWIGTEHWCATGPGVGAVWDALEGKRTRDDGEQLGSGRAWRRPMPRTGHKYVGKFEPGSDAPALTPLIDAARGVARVEVRPLEIHGRPVRLVPHDGDALTAFITADGDMVALRTSHLEAVARIVGAPGSGPWMVTAAAESTASKPVTIAPGGDRAIGSTPVVALLMPVRVG